MNMNYSKKTREELINICKERKIKGYSKLKKDDIILLLEKAPITCSKSALKPSKKAGPINDNLKPLIKWSGGKGDEIKQFVKYIPSDYDTYIEPFIGGGALFFNLRPKKAVISDVHTELIDLYKSVSEGKSDEIYGTKQKL